MDHEFWHERWQRGEIGFHRAQVHPILTAQIAHLVAPPATVFVPLSGKTLDMKWLLDEGYQVVGVELSAAAIEAFMEEHQLAYTCTQQGPFHVYQAPGITLYQGDFFELQPVHLEACHAWYDRAALVALPVAMRQEYNQHLQQILPPSAKGLLITVEYPEGYWKGPPFAIWEAEVRTAYEDRYQVHSLPSQPGFIEGGDSQVLEHCYLLEPKAQKSPR